MEIILGAMKNRQESIVVDGIRRALQGSGMSMKKLSDKSGVQYGSVYGLLVSGKDARLSTIERICAVLGLELKLTKTRSKKNEKRGE